MGKYNLYEITIGDILDNEDASELFWELVPEAKDYSEMLELGRGFTFEQAMPFIESVADGLGITNVQERVEEFKTKLEAL